MAARLARLVTVALVGALLTAFIGAAPAGAATAAAVTAAPTARISGAWMVHQGSSTTITATVSAGSGQLVQLQRKVSATAWMTIKTARMKTSGIGGKAVMAFVPKTGSAVYRAVVSKDSLRLTTNSLTIRTTTSAVYIGKARYYMSAYCPQTPIVANLSRSGSLAGLATTQWTYESRWSGNGPVTTTYKWSQKIQLRPDLPDDALRWVSLHECGHIVQYRQLVKGENAFYAALAATDKLYNGNGIEKQADCMAGVVVGNMTHSYYTHSCSTAQRKAAATLWHDYGKRYQSPNYSWVRVTSG